MATPSAAGGGGRRMVNMLEAKTHLWRLGVARGQFTVPDSIDAANPLIAELFEQA